MENLAWLLEENEARKARIHRVFDPVSGENSPGGPRFRIDIDGHDPRTLYLPETMRDEELVRILSETGGMAAATVRYNALHPGEESVGKSMLEEMFERLRIRHDFPYWAARYVRIKPKGGGPDVAFTLNRPQRKFVEMLEGMRQRDMPVRVILLKARQWGGSTCAQLYRAWLQLVHCVGLNSLIIAHQGAGSDEIKDMFDRMIQNYPMKMLAEPGETVGEKEKKTVRVGNSGSTMRLVRRDCKIKVGTAERPDSCRGGDYNLVHLSEVGIWKMTDGKCPEDIVRSACSGILLQPLTMIVLESTANGRGNYFHREYLAACRGDSQFQPLFVAWYEIDTYAIPFRDEKAREHFARILLEKRDESAESGRRESGRYLWSLWERGATLEAINWYVAERLKYSDHSGMASEYPSDEIEAFNHSGQRVFALEAVERMRADIEEPLARGEVESSDTYRFDRRTVRFFPDSSGNLEIWRYPDAERWSDRYLTVVDIGGRSSKADWSVIAVFDRAGEDGRPEVVAQWRGHIDHDLLAEKAACIAAYYQNSLLVVESNTLETTDRERYVDGDQMPYLLTRLQDRYPSLYARQCRGGGVRYGFHTNTATKPMAVGELVRAVREHGYVERCEECLDELSQYERRQNGSFGAISGCHDDILMTRAIALYVSSLELDTPRRVVKKPMKPAGMRRGLLTECDFR